MWLFTFALMLVVILVVAGLLVGGVFTFILIPIALIVTAFVVLFSALGQRKKGPVAPSNRTSPQTAANQSPSTPPVPTTPDEFVDVRRGAQ